MDFNSWLQDPGIQSWLLQGSVGLAILISIIFIFRKLIRVGKIREERGQEKFKIKGDNQLLSNEIRQRIIVNFSTLSRVLSLNPVVAGNSSDDTTLVSRNRAKCLSTLMEALHRDTKSQGIRMAEFIHKLSDNLVQSYGMEGSVHVLIDTQAIILDVDSAGSVALIMNELISNAFQYAPVPGEKSKVNIILKERENKLFIGVGDNGTGMKSPYIPKFLFGLQLVNTLVQKHRGEMIITSRPGTRFEITFKEYQKAEREVYVTPTTRMY